MLNKEIHYKEIEKQISNASIQKTIKEIQEKFEKEIYAKHLKAF